MNSINILMLRKTIDWLSKEVNHIIKKEIEYKENYVDNKNARNIKNNILYISSLSEIHKKVC